MSSEPVLVARELAKSFASLRAVDGISLELQPGEIMGLVGPNGSGKTTLINLISGSIARTGGRSCLAGSGPPVWRRTAWLAKGSTAPSRCRSPSTL